MSFTLLLFSVPLPDLQRRQPNQLRRVGVQHRGAPAAREGQELHVQGSGLEEDWKEAEEEGAASRRSVILQRLIFIDSYLLPLLRGTIM